jgi:phosphoribosyl-ATP pyrophosphohydrolase
MSELKLNSQILGQLYDVIESRRGGDPKISHTAKLFKKGRGKICKKFGEEAVEVIIAALSEKKSNVISESADVLYHLLVLWSEAGISPDEVWGELQNRVSTSGIEEKANRSKGEEGS